MKTKPKTWTVEERFPTKKARDAADETIDVLPVDEPMTTYLDVWLETYRAAGGIERKP